MEFGYIHIYSNLRTAFIATKTCGLLPQTFYFLCACRQLRQKTKHDIEVATNIVQELIFFNKMTHTTLDLQKMGLIPLTSVEEEQINGGFWWLVGIGIYLYDNRDRFIQGVKEGVKDFL